MRETARARALVAVAGSLYLAGFLLGTIAPAAIATAVLLYLMHARFAARAAFDEARLQITRRVLEPVIHEGAPFHVEMDATATTLPAGIAMEVHDETPDDIVPMSAPILRGPTMIQYAARPNAKGSRTFAGVRVLLTDTRGFWQETHRIPVETSLQIFSSLDAIEAGRRLARREALEASTTSPIGLLVRDLEFEAVRDYVGGDRLRDVDWKRVALYERLLTKTWEKELEATVVLALDAGRTMRARAKESALTKLDHAAVLMLELAEAASERNYAIGYVAFDEVGVIDETPATRHRSVPRRLAERLSQLPGRVTAQRRLDVGLPGVPSGDDEELDFLGILTSLRSGGRATSTRGPRKGIRSAVERLSQGAGDRKLFFIVFTDLEQVPDDTVQAIARATRAGHRAIVVVHPGTLFFAPPTEVRARDLENAYREHETRRRTRLSLERAGAQVLELGPQDTALEIVEASHKKTRRGRGGVR